MDEKNRRFLKIIGGIALGITGLTAGLHFANKYQEKRENNQKPYSIDRVADLNNDTLPDMIYTDRNGERQIMYGYKDGKMYFPEDLVKKVSEDTIKSLEGDIK